MKQPIQTDKAPAAIGTYSQAIRRGNLVFLSGQVGLDPARMKLVEGGFEAQLRQVLDNLGAVCAAAGGGLDDLVRLTVYLVDMGDFPVVNAVMEEYFQPPFPARAAIGVAALPLGAVVEMDAILALDDGGR